MINMRLVLPLLLLLFEVHSASPGTHSLKYFYAVVSGDTNLPEFTAVGKVDNEEFIYFDNNKKEAVSKTEWIRQNTDQDYWYSETENLIHLHQIFKNNLHTAMERFNQSKSTGGVHTFQRMYGCEWNDETGEINGFDQYGYDGEDFIFLDLKNARYVAPVREALISKNKWDRDRARLDYEKQYFTYKCADWLKRYVLYWRSVLERTVSPEVSLLQRDPSSPVSPEVSLLQRDPSSPVVCHATGLHHRQVMVSWQKNGEDVTYDVDLRETVPNGDGTFQKSSVLLVKSEDWRNNPDVYTCVVQHGGRDIIVSLNVKNIKTNSGSNNMGIIIGIVVAVIVLTAAVVVGVFMWKRSKSGYGKTNTSETDSENSDRPMQKA